MISWETFDQLFEFFNLNFMYYEVNIHFLINKNLKVQRFTKEKNNSTPKMSNTYQKGVKAPELALEP